MAGETTTTFSRQVAITNVHGLHARPCLAIVNTVRRHKADVSVQMNGQVANAANILELMSLGAVQGQTLTLSARGADAETVLDALTRLFDNEFEIHYKE